MKTEKATRESYEGERVVGDLIDRDGNSSVVLEDEARLEGNANAEPRHRGRGRALRWLRGFTGSLTAGMVILALLELGIQGLASAKDTPGPGLSTVLGHVVAAVVAVIAQWFADRFASRQRVWVVVVATLVVVLDAVTLLLLFWWR